MNPGISIVYVTHREQPEFGWFADALARQLEADDDVEVVVVDGLFSDDRVKQFEKVAGGRFPLVVAPAKPSPWNGSARLARRPMFAPGSARNTGIVLASRAYIAFVDDCSVPLATWLEEVREAAAHEYIVGGAYTKRWEMDVVDGVLVSSRATSAGIDTRWELGDDQLVVRVPGGMLYGASMGIPRRVLVELNGFDELCDGLGQEDCQLGLRIDAAGYPVFYSRRLMTVESEEHHQRGEPLWRVDPVLGPERYMAKLLEFGLEKRSTDGAFDASHLVIDLALGLRQTKSLGNHYELADLRPEDLPGTAEGIPTIFWVDGRPIAEV